MSSTPFVTDAAQIVIVVWRAKEAESMPMKHWLRIADNLSRPG
jgi:hypothetical protein